MKPTTTTGFYAKYQHGTQSCGNVFIITESLTCKILVPLGQEIAQSITMTNGDISSDWIIKIENVNDKSLSASIDKDVIFKHISVINIFTIPSKYAQSSLMIVNISSGNGLLPSGWLSYITDTWAVGCIIFGYMTPYWNNGLTHWGGDKMAATSQTMF